MFLLELFGVHENGTQTVCENGLWQTNALSGQHICWQLHSLEEEEKCAQKEGSIIWSDPIEFEKIFSKRQSGGDSGVPSIWLRICWSRQFHRDNALIHVARTIPISDVWPATSLDLNIIIENIWSFGSKSIQERPAIQQWSRNKKKSHWCGVAKHPTGLNSVTVWWSTSPNPLPYKGKYTYQNVDQIFWFRTNDHEMFAP